VKLPYREGTWFAVPLRSGGFGTGIIARSTRFGRVVFGYFFGPRLNEPALLADVATLRPERAALVVRFGDLALIEGAWPIIGESPSWRREEWPMPDFVRHEELSGRSWRERYDDKNPNKLLSSEPVVSSDPTLEPNRMCGAGAVAILLSRLIVGASSGG